MSTTHLASSRRIVGAVILLMAAVAMLPGCARGDVARDRQADERLYARLQADKVFEQQRWTAMLQRLTDANAAYRRMAEARDVLFFALEPLPSTKRRREWVAHDDVPVEKPAQATGCDGLESQQHALRRRLSSVHRGLERSRSVLSPRTMSLHAKEHALEAAIVALELSDSQCR